MRTKPPGSGRSKPAKQYRVLVLDDHPMTRYGIARLIELEPDLICCGEAENTRRAMAAVKTTKPDVVLVDLTLPGGEGLEFIKDLRALHPGIAVLVVTMHDEELYAARALRAGARGYLMKSEGGEKLVEAIHQILRGNTYLSTKMSEKAADILAARHERVVDPGLSLLTDREFEVFRLLGQGLTTRELGQCLHLGTKTVETHRLHIREKLRIKTGAALIQYAVRWAGAQELL